MDLRSWSSHREVPGDHPSTTIILDELGPKQLGALLAVYEHKVFAQGAIWGINFQRTIGCRQEHELVRTRTSSLGIDTLDGRHFQR